MTVAELLTQSRAAHSRFRGSAGRINDKGRISEAPRLPKCAEAIQEALRVRVEAEVLDPQHSDPAWREDFDLMKGQPSQTLMAFYVRYLAPGAAVVCSAIDQKAPPNEPVSQAGATGH